MTALAIVLAGLAASELAALLVVLSWYRDADRERDALRAERDALSVTRTTLSDSLDREKNLRAIAEAQRTEAQRRARAYLADNMREATNDEIASAVADLFAAPLSVLPSTAATPTGAAADRDSLLSPWVQPAGAAGADPSSGGLGDP